MAAKTIEAERKMLPVCVNSEDGLDWWEITPGMWDRFTREYEDPAGAKRTGEFLQIG